VDRTASNQLRICGFNSNEKQETWTLSVLSNERVSLISFQHPKAANDQVILPPWKPDTYLSRKAFVVTGKKRIDRDADRMYENMQLICS
jgi:hypothetical protein